MAQARAFAAPGTAKTGETLRTIYERRSVRKFKQLPVDRELIEEVLDAGRMAPSAMNRQPWHFYVVTEKKLIEAFSHEIIKKGLRMIGRKGIGAMGRTARSLMGLLKFLNPADMDAMLDPIFHGAPVVIFLTGPVSSEWATLDIGMCAQNIMLAAKSMGLDTCPVGLGKFVMKTKLYGRLQIPAGETVRLAIILGYGDEAPEVHKRLQDNILFVE